MEAGESETPSGRPALGVSCIRPHRDCEGTVIDLSKSTLKQVKKAMKILDRPGWAYWLAWGVVLSVLSFGIANIITALKL